MALSELSSAAEATSGYPSSTSSNLTTHHPPAASTPSQPGFYPSAPMASSYSQGIMASGKQSMPRLREPYQAPSKKTQDLPHEDPAVQTISEVFYKKPWSGPFTRRHNQHVDEKCHNCAKFGYVCDQRPPRCTACENAKKSCKTQGKDAAGYQRRRRVEKLTRNQEQK